MLTIISRISNYGFKNFWRNGWLSLATVAIMLLALMVFNGLLLFHETTSEVVTSIRDKIDISVSFKTTAKEDAVLNVKRALEAHPEVAHVDYISPDEALTIFRERHKEDPEIAQSLAQIEENPLGAALSIKAKEPEQYAAIAKMLGVAGFMDIIDQVDYHENKTVIDKLTALVSTLSSGGFILAIVLALIAGLVVFNTIRLAIYSNRDEISIMRAVGASNIFVRGPYMIEGMIAGTISAAASMMLMVPIVYFASPYLKALVQSFDLFSYFYTNFFTLLFYQLLFGIVIATTSSFVAVRRYLKN